MNDRYVLTFSKETKEHIEQSITHFYGKKSDKIADEEEDINYLKRLSTS